MSRLAILLTFLTAFSVGWVPVFAAPVRLATEMTAQVTDQKPMAGHAHACAGDQNHCMGTAKAPHPALCSACIAIPAIALITITTPSTRMVVPHGTELPLVAQASAPLSPPPKPQLIASISI
ncbi:hypothetical protein [Phyllobacterium sp. OV277]|uniref:hypothetical protein n=1 Tax=Phyllobacterium sp. OV277 TaxID=1882772 RepID=UPI000889A1A9|nr:hypothetical protein [Phyllobacterium sp. OV277]SDP65646.1 hypothetical protein SAMN05443582_107149 [Phyllobacterium sp. OV277]